jgi:hypothetical protein
MNKKLIYLFAVSLAFGGDIKLANNTTTPIEILTSLSSDHDEEIRIAVARMSTAELNSADFRKKNYE